MNSGGGVSGAASLAGPSAGSESMSGGAARAEWRRIYDRLEAQVEVVAAHNGIQHEFWNARDNINQHRLHQVELSRSRWEAACKELLPQDSPKLTELREHDLEDSRLCKDLFEIENSELKVQLKDVGNCAQLNESHADHENTTRDLREGLRKLKQAYKTICSNKDKEISALLGVKDFLWNQFRTTEKENMALLKTKEVEAAQATEAAKKLQHSIEEMQWAALKLQQNIKEMQVAAQNKDNEIGRSQAEAVNAKKRVLILEGKLLEMHSLIKEKNDEIQKLKKGQPESLKRKCASSVSNETSEECSKDTDEMDLEEYTKSVKIKMHDGKTIDLEILDSDTIYDVKARIQDQEGIPACQQRLMIDDKLLVGNCAALQKNYYIRRDGSTLTLQLVLQGMHIFVNDMLLGIMTFEVERADTVYSVKAKIFNETDLAPVRQLLHFDGNTLEEDRTLADYNIQNESTLGLWVSFPPEVTNRTEILLCISNIRDGIRISVETETGRRIIEYYALESEKVGSVKEKIHGMSPIPLDQQCLYFDGKMLEDDRTLAFYGINYRDYHRGWGWGSCILLLQLRLPGGC